MSILQRLSLRGMFWPSRDRKVSWSAFPFLARMTLKRTERRRFRENRCGYRWCGREYREGGYFPWNTNCDINSTSSYRNPSHPACIRYFSPRTPPFEEATHFKTIAKAYVIYSTSSWRKFRWRHFLDRAVDYSVSFGAADSKKQTDQEEMHILVESWPAKWHLPIYSASKGGKIRQRGRVVKALAC